jgi:hypothetical protein
VPLSLPLRIGMSRLRALRIIWKEVSSCPRKRSAHQIAEASCCGAVKGRINVMRLLEKVFAESERLFDGARRPEGTWIGGYPNHGAQHHR